MPVAFSWLMAPLATATLVLPLVAVAPDASRSELEARYPGDYRLIDGVRLRLRDTGPRDAPAILMLHGFCASLETWEPWAQRLSERYRVVRFDLPGFGLTGPDPTRDYSDARQAEIIADLMDALRIPRASLIGSSLGGRLAFHFASRHPARIARLVLVSPASGETPEAAPWLRAALPYLAPPAPVIKLMLANAYARPDAISATTLTRYREMLLAPGVRRAIADRMQQAPRPEPASPIVEAPTLLIWGESDGVVPIAAAADYLRRLPNGSLVRLPGLGHLPFEEDPDRALAPLQSFLAEAEPSTEKRSQASESFSP